MQAFYRGSAILAAAAVAAALSAVAPAMSGPTSYICTLTDYTAYQTGVGEWVPEDALKKTLAIDRRTGAVIHPVLGTTSFNEVRVLNPGSVDWSFKLMADSGGGGNVVYIEVGEFEEGSRKSLVAVAGHVAYSGFCE